MEIMGNIHLDCLIVPQDNHCNNQGLGFFCYKPQNAFNYQNEEEFQDGRLPMLYTKAIILPPKYLLRSKINMQGWRTEDIIRTTSDKDAYWEKIPLKKQANDKQQP